MGIEVRFDIQVAGFHPCDVQAARVHVRAEMGKPVLSKEGEVLVELPG